MITPSFGITATERVLPKLALDFTTASLDSRITFTRTTGASNPATYVNSSGVLTAATNNQPRFDYDAVTLACKGLLIEESRQNILLRSQEFNDAYWTKTRVTITANAAIAPDGTLTADKIISDVGLNSHFVQRASLTSTTGTISVFAKAAEFTFLKLSSNANSFAASYFDLVNGTVAFKNPNHQAFIENFGNGWYRCAITPSAAFTSVAIENAGNGANPTHDGNGIDGIYIWGAQAEAGAFPTSYIPTTTTALTRNADMATMTGTNFSSWFNAGTGAFNCAVLPKSATGTKPVLQFDDATALNTITMQGNATAVELKITTLSVLQSTLSTGTITANTAYGSCGAWTAGSNALSKSGGVATTGSPVSIPTLTQSRLGSDGTNYFNGWLQKINYWPQRLTNSEVQAFSK